MGLAVLHQVRWQCLQPSVLTFGSVQRMRKSTLTELASQLFGQDVAAEPPTQCGHLRHFQRMRRVFRAQWALQLFLVRQQALRLFCCPVASLPSRGKRPGPLRRGFASNELGVLTCVRLCAKRHRVRRSLLACEKAK